GECSAGRKCHQQFPHSLAHVGLLFSGLAATPPRDRAAPHTGSEAGRVCEFSAACRGDKVRGQPRIHTNWHESVLRPVLMNGFVLSFVCIRVHSWLNPARLAVTLVCLTSCATVSHHQFAEPTAGWQTKTGQLMYRTPQTTLIGEAFVRFSNTG